MTDAKAGQKPVPTAEPKWSKSASKSFPGEGGKTGASAKLSKSRGGVLPRVHQKKATHEGISRNV
jgi:hypothetical protein